MELRTSYFANLKKIDKNKYFPIAISRFVPKNISIKLTQIPELAPSPELLREKDEERYVEKFNRQLEKLEPFEVYEMLYTISKGKIPVLICYENPQKFCHRHIVAEWFEKAGIRVKELGFEKCKRERYRIVEDKGIQSLF